MPSAWTAALPALHLPFFTLSPTLLTTMPATMPSSTITASISSKLKPAARGAARKERTAYCDMGNSFRNFSSEPSLHGTGQVHDRQDDSHHDHRHHDRHADGGDGHEQGEQAIQGIAHFDVDRVGDLQQHAVEFAGFLAHRHHLQGELGKAFAVGEAESQPR